MFVHNFKYTLKILFKNKMLIFWTYAFPVIMGALFSLAFSDIENNEKLDIINIAIVEEVKEADSDDVVEDMLSEEIASGEMSFDAIPSQTEILKDSLKSMAEEGEDQMFNISYLSEEKAKDKLQEGRISGYLVLSDEEPKVVVKESGINETVFWQVVSQIMQTTGMVTTMTENEVEKQIAAGNYQIDGEAIEEQVLSQLNKQEVSLNDISGENLSYTMIEYYTLIAMTCLYSAMLGMYAINNVLANMSKKGMRVGVSPVKKGQLVLSSVCASYVVQLIGLVILFAFTVFVMKVDYGNNIWAISLLALIGCLAGLSMGIAISSLIKTGENTKTGIIISITMLGCFLSGMMGITMKYVVDKNIPFLNKINPASMITDGFYALYYYDTLDRYWFNVGSLLVFSLLMIVISFGALKKQVYESL